MKFIELAIHYKNIKNDLRKASAKHESESESFLRYQRSLTDKHDIEPNDIDNLVSLQKDSDKALVSKQSLELQCIQLEKDLIQMLSLLPNREIHFIDEYRNQHKIAYSDGELKSTF